jgi:uncharacterized protein (TIGR01244 family)
MHFRKLDERTFVSGQLEASDLANAAAQGIAMIVNNRPDGEQIGQPASSALEKAAEALGLAYRHIPVEGGLSQALVDAMVEALDAADGPVLAFCTSGTRSAFLWALARALKGDDPAQIAAKAETAGYDLSPIRRFLS